MIGAPKKPISWREEQEKFSGVKFVDVGRTDPGEYLQPIPVNHTRNVTGKVTEIICPTAVKISFGKGDSIAVVIPIGNDVPKVGSEIFAEINNGAAVMKMARKSLG